MSRVPDNRLRPAKCLFHMIGAASIEPVAFVDEPIQSGIRCLRDLVVDSELCRRDLRTGYSLFTRYHER